MIKTYSRPAKFAELKGYCPFAKDDDYVEITEWWNGEGFDVSISEEKTISLTWGEWELIQKMVEHKSKPNTDYRQGYGLGYDVGYSTAVQELKNNTESKDRTIDYLSMCPMCGGPADNGHDRGYPPNPYVCTKCEED